MNELMSLNNKSCFKNLNDQALLSLTHKKAQQERSLTLQVIELLQEIRDRHLHIKRGYSSLHDFCVKELKYHIWMRDKGRYTYVDPISKRACESRHHLQYEHIRPLAIGGENTASNLRLLCFQHNKLMAMKSFGTHTIHKRIEKQNRPSMQV